MGMGGERGTLSLRKRKVSLCGRDMPEASPEGEEKRWPEVLRVDGSPLGSQDGKSSPTQMGVLLASEAAAAVASQGGLFHPAGLLLACVCFPFTAWGGRDGHPSPRHLTGRCAGRLRPKLRTREKAERRGHNSSTARSSLRGPWSSSLLLL